MICQVNYISMIKMIKKEKGQEWETLMNEIDNKTSFFDKNN